MDTKTNDVDLPIIKDDEHWAEKRARQTTKRREHNVMLRSKMRTV